MLNYTGRVGAMNRLSKLAIGLPKVASRLHDLSSPHGYRLAPALPVEDVCFGLILLCQWDLPQDVIDTQLALVSIKPIQ